MNDDEQRVTDRILAETLPGTAWTKPMPTVGTNTDGTPITGTATVTEVRYQRGEWFVDYVTTFPETARQGFGTAEMKQFMTTRTRVEAPT